jgi:hypothetical protein
MRRRSISVVLVVVLLLQQRSSLSSSMTELLEGARLKYEALSALGRRRTPRKLVVVVPPDALASNTTELVEGPRLKFKPAPKALSALSMRRIPPKLRKKQHLRQYGYK